MLKYADIENEDGIMFTADIDKAFHSVEYYLIFATLKKLNIGSRFIQWIRIMLNGRINSPINQPETYLF